MTDSEFIMREASGIVLGPSTRPCPSCGGVIERLAIVSGAYDAKPGSVWPAVVVVIVLIVLGLAFC